MENPTERSAVRRAFGTGWKYAKKTNLTMWIFVGMVVGIIIGAVNPAAGVAIKPLGTAFIRMIQAVEVPLIFSTLVVGIAGHGEDLGRVGRLAVKTIVYFVVVTFFALVIGLCMVNLCRPGDGVNIPTSATNDLGVQLAGNASSITWDGELFLIIPTSFFDAASRNVVLSIVFCAVMFSVAIMHSDKKSRDIMLDFCQALSNIMFKVVNLVMNYAPIGIGASLAATVGQNGVGILANLGKLIGSLYGALVVFAVVVFLPITLVSRIPLLGKSGFLYAIGQPWLIAFSTASSESALPKAMKNMEVFGVPKKIVAFVIPCGYSFNLDGTTLYLSLACIFAAQAGNIQLKIGEQLAIMASLILSSKGVAAIPRASLIVLAATVQNYGLPLQTIAMIAGVDALMDMARTSINVTGNCLASCVMARWEGEFRGEEWREERIAAADEEEATVKDFEVTERTLVNLESNKNRTEEIFV